MQNKIIEQRMVEWSKLEWLQTPETKDISPDNLRKLKNSLLQNGFIQPFNVWDNEGQLTILDGHHRKIAMESLRSEGFEVPDTLPANIISVPDRKTAIKYLLLYTSQYAEINKSGLLHFLDVEAIDIASISEEVSVSLDIDFADIEVNSEDESASEIALEKPAVVREDTPIQLGDEILIGKHRLLCGSADERATLEKLIGDKKVKLVYADPPYGVDFRSNRRIDTQKFDRLMNDNVMLSEWAQHLSELTQCWTFVWTSWKVVFDWQKICSVFGDLSNLIVWAKKCGGMGDLKKTFISDYELALCYNRGNELTGKRLSSVWEKTRDHNHNYIHPTQKPVELAELALGSCTVSGDIVLDCFAGSGSTLLACEKLGRTGLFVELDPRYCDAIIRRALLVYPNLEIVRNGKLETEYWKSVKLVESE